MSLDWGGLCPFALRSFLITRFLSSRIGGEKVLLLSASAWGFLTVVTPLLTHVTSAHLVFMTSSRFLMGLLQGETPVLSAPVCVSVCPGASLQGGSLAVNSDTNHEVGGA